MPVAGVEEPRTDVRGPEVPGQHGIAARCDVDLRAHDRRTHARQAIREGDAAYVRLVQKPPLELRVRLFQAGVRVRLAASGLIQPEANGQILLRGKLRTDLPVADRLALLERIRDLLEARSEQFARAIVAEMGAAISFSGRSWATGRATNTPMTPPTSTASSPWPSLLITVLLTGFIAATYGFGIYLVSALETELYRIPFVIERSTYSFAALVVIGAAVISGLIVRRLLNRLDLVEVHHNVAQIAGESDAFAIGRDFENF